MPVPLVLIAGAAASSVFLAAATGMMTRNEILQQLRGKRVALLGERGVGKTHLTTFLTTGELPTEYKGTLTPEKVRGRRLRLNELSLKVNILDVQGSKDAYAVWRDLYKESALILYLVYADRLFAGDSDAESRVREDLQHIADWQRMRKSSPPLIIVGTHSDLDPDYAVTSAHEYTYRFRRLPIVEELVTRAGGSEIVKVVVGTMKTLEGTQALVHQLFKEVVS